MMHGQEMHNMSANKANMIRLFAGMMLCAVMGVWSQAAFAQEDLCPDIGDAKQNSPQDSSGMQASIERLNLCVERARLLKQLDEIAKQRDEILTKVTNPGISVDANSISGIPALPSGALPSLPTDVTGLKPGDVKITGAAGNPLDRNSSAVSPSPVVKKSSWKVRKIWGQGDSMRAQLSDSSGTLLNVVRGDALPDDGVVEAVSVKGVAISLNGKVSDLPWDDMISDKATK